MNIVERAEKINALRAKNYTVKRDGAFWYVFTPTGKRVERTKTNIDAADAFERYVKLGVRKV